MKSIIACRKYVFILSLISSISIPASSWAINHGLLKTTMELQSAHFDAKDQRLSTILSWMEHYEPAPTSTKAFKYFNEKATVLLTFFSRLHRSEQEVYFTLLKVFSHFRSDIKTFNGWYRAVSGFHVLFKSHKSEWLTHHFTAVPISIWQTAKRDPLLMTRLLLTFPLDNVLKHYHTYWSIILLKKYAKGFPSLKLFQKEMSDIVKKISKPDASHQPVIFQWMRRYVDVLKERIAEIKQMIASQSPTVTITDGGANINLKSYFITRLSRENIVKKVFPDRKGIFKRFFPWKTHWVKYDSDEDILSARVKLSTGNTYDLKFSIVESVRRRSDKLYYTLEIPTLSKLNLAIKNWEIICELRSHPRYSDLTVVKLTSDLNLRFAAARQKLRMRETLKKLRKELPIRLAALKAYLDALSN